MTKARLDIIDVAFNKMDKTGDGVITVADLMGTYDVSRHPKFISGEKTKEQIIKKYLDVFQRNDTDDEVCKARFPSKRNRLRCVRCVNENRKKRKRLRWKAANHGCHCYDRAFLLAASAANRNARS